MFATALRALEIVHPRSLKHLYGHLSALVEGRLWLNVVIGMVLGLLAGAAIGPSVGWIDPETGLLIGTWLALPGQLFLAIIQMIVIPLVFASIIRGLAASQSVDQLRKMGIAVTVYFVVTTAVAAFIGLWIAGLLEPGRSLAGKMPSVESATAAPISTPSLPDIPEALIGLLPGNPLDAMVQGQMLQVVIFAMLVGVALLSMAPKQAKPLLDLLGSLQEVCMTIVRWAMLLAPVAVFGLMARLMSQIGTQALLTMGFYVTTVLIGLLILLVLYLGIVYAAARQPPLSFLAATREVMLLAFSTSSSAAVMPLSIKTAEEKLAVRPSVSQFVIPLGATINMNGTALYQGVAAAFLAQVYGIEMSMSAMVLVVVMAVGASIGSPGTPGVGIAILAMVLDTIGIPPAGIALIMGVDRILDMSRTAINVTGDIIACKVMDAWIGSARTLEEERAEQAAHERQRAASGADILTTH